jgi:hypothetical protein
LVFCLVLKTYPYLFHQANFLNNKWRFSPSNTSKNSMKLMHFASRFDRVATKFSCKADAATDIENTLMHGIRKKRDDVPGVIHLTVSLGDHGDLFIAITDNGPGIHAAIQSRLIPVPRPSGEDETDCKKIVPSPKRKNTIFYFNGITMLQVTSRVLEMGSG